MKTDDYAKIILEYMKLNMPLEKCDVILGLGCLDTRVAVRASQLMLDGYGDLLVLSGGYGKITKDFNSKAEAEVFEDVALKMGVDKQKILLETYASNTGENILFTQNLLESKGFRPKSILIATKTYMERRVYATFKKQWRSDNVKLLITSPQIPYDKLYGNDIPKNLFLNIMVGDLQRIREFPKRGFQIEQEIPESVWQAYEALVSEGYNRHLLA